MVRFLQRQVVQNQNNTRMKPITILFLAAVLVFPLSVCSTSRSATTGTAVGAVAGAVVAGPVGLLAGGAVGNAYGDQRDHERR